ncbi:unnamed protein product [Paramecium primaurelia]|uniref:Uncharacterized protein n=1 Tax=Paramecium primaurelia TaxID=5886 RepID=A0A8S1PAL3_PARPR|nr:unnamed protein product [Paramecium primaurelia]
MKFQNALIVSSFCQDLTSVNNYWINFAIHRLNSNDLGRLITINSMVIVNALFYQLNVGLIIFFKDKEKLISNLSRHFMIHIVVLLWAIFVNGIINYLL